MKYMKTYLLFLQTNRCVMAKKGAAATNDHYISTIIVVNKIGDPCLKKFHCSPSFPRCKYLGNIFKNKNFKPHQRY